MKTTIDMARQVYGAHTEWTGAPLDRLEQFVALVRADERWEQSKRRGVLAFCPYTGKPRHPSDIASDPHGILILVPDQPLRAVKKDSNA
jgi:hypothetical protein